MSRPSASACEPAEQVIHQDTSTPSDDLIITPLAPEAPAPVCRCSTSWEHRFWGCPAKATSSLRVQNEPGGGTWMKRDEVWKGLLKGEAFSIEQLENEPSTHDLYYALHQEKDVLLRFLNDRHVKAKEKWLGIHQEESGRWIAPDPREQEITVERGMMVVNKLVEMLSKKENWKALYGTELEEEESFRLELLVFDLSDVKVKEEGGVEGTVGWRKRSEDCEGCKNCQGGQPSQPEWKEVGTMTNIFDPLYDYVEEGAQTEMEKPAEEVEGKTDRHDSGVGLEAEEEVAVSGIKDLKIGRKNARGKETESSDNEEGGVEVVDE